LNFWSKSEGETEMSEFKNKPKVLTHLGYAIRKDFLTPEQQEKLRTTLTVAPKTNGKFLKAPDPFTVYLESSTRFYVPRMWGMSEYSEPDGSLLSEGKDLRKDLEFVGTPYDYQKEIVQKFIDSGANGLICVPCGRGKTFMAINCAYKIGKKFMIVVDKEFLLQQWSGELKALMPGIRIGVLQENLKQIDSDVIVSKELTLPQLKDLARENKLKVGGNRDDLINRLKEKGINVEPKREVIEYDCTIAMIQTLVLRDFGESDFNSFGLSIFDECHHLGAAHFSKALLKVQPKHMLGLSATPTRDDGLTKVFEWFLGTPIHWEKTREADPDVIVKKVSFACDDAKYNEIPCDFRGEPILARLLTNVVECEERNLAIDKVMEELVKEKNRRILVLSERKSHLDRIEKGLPKGTTFSYYIGGMKEEVREEGARTAQVLLGTYQMASEAMNIKTLNTMVMASPRKKIEQSTGRILRTRKDEREVAPLIVDIVDSTIDVYNGQWIKRRAYYRKCAYKIEGEPERKKGGKTCEKEETPITQASGCMIMDSDDE
jgi:superfamily II DNA or RNA helicase